MKYYTLILFILFLLGGIIYIEIMTWNECLSENSLFYCFRTINS